eukprot:SAG31_NODE_5045_length_2778_cov_22.202688_5_plen_147_part_00
MAIKVMTDQHTAYFLYILNRGLPASTQGLDANRLTLTHFCIAGLAVLGKLSSVDEAPIINWVLSLLVDSECDCGFRGGPFLASGSSLHSDSDHAWMLRVSPAGRSQTSAGRWKVRIRKVDDSEDFGHIAMTYSALVVLTLLSGRNN